MKQNILAPSLSEQAAQGSLEPKMNPRKPIPHEAFAMSKPNLVLSKLKLG